MVHNTIVPTITSPRGTYNTFMSQVSSHLEQDAAELEIAAHPALDALTRHINSVNLERVRRIKNKLARLLNNKVEKLKEILEGLLDDDSDLRDMNLTARRERERLEKERELEVARVLSGDAAEEVQEGPRGVERVLSDPLGLRTSSKEEELLDDVDNTVEEVEMVLEPYFMRLDNTFNKLRSLTEYIDDTEVCDALCAFFSFKSTTGFHQHLPGFKTESADQNRPCDNMRHVYDDGGGRGVGADGHEPAQRRVVGRPIVLLGVLHDFGHPGGVCAGIHHALCALYSLSKDSCLLKR